MFCIYGTSLPAADLNSGVVFAQKKFQFELYKIKSKLRPGNEPLLLSHGEKTSIAILLIHGFTASPWEMKDLGNYLHAKGFNVYVMRLAGHGTKPEDLLNIKWEDWYKSTEDAYEITRLLGNKVVVAGLSTGGLLALHLSVNKPDIAGVISLSSALYFQNWKICFSGIGQYFADYDFRPLDESLKPYYYEKRALSAINEVYKLSHIGQREIYKISKPILIIQSKQDKTIKPYSSEYIYNKVESKNKKLFLLDNGPHVLVTSENPEQKKVFEIINSWLNNNLQ